MNAPSSDVAGGSVEKVSDGIGGRISVSPAGMTFFGEPRETYEFLEDLALAGEDFFGKAFFGDLNATFRGECLWGFTVFFAGEGGGFGTGGTCESIFSVSHACFSSMNFRRSVYK